MLLNENVLLLGAKNNATDQNKICKEKFNVQNEQKKF